MSGDVLSLLDLGWKLVLVLGLAVLAMRALRWLSSPVLTPDNPLRIVARLPIGPQQAIVVVSVGEKRLLIGQTANQITLLTELAADDAEAAGSAANVAATPMPGSITIGRLTIQTNAWKPFADRLVELVSRGRLKPGLSARSASTGQSDFGHSQGQDRVDRRLDD